METLLVAFSIILIWFIPIRWIITIVILSTFNNIYVGSFDLATIIIVMCFLRTFKNALPAAFKSPFVRAYSFFLLWAIISLIWSTDTEAAIASLRATIRIFLAIVITYYVINDKDDLRAVVVGCAMGIAYALLGTLGIIPDAQFIDSIERVSVGTNSSNTFAIQIIWSATLVYYYLRQRLKPTQLSQILWGLLFLALLWVPIASSGSRAGLFSLIVIAIVLSLNLTPLKLALMGTFLSIVAFSGIFVINDLPLSNIPFINQDLRQRLEYTFAGQDDTNRQQLWQTGLLMGSENFFSGVGIGNSVARYREYAPRIWQDPYAPRPRALHNTFITVFAELGILGLVLLLQFFRHWVKTIDWSNPELLGLFTAYAMLILITGFFHSFEQITLIMILLTTVHKIFLISPLKEQDTVTRVRI